MSDPYGRVKGGRLAFKGGDLATRSKSIDKKNKKKKKKKHQKSPEDAAVAGEEVFPGDAVDIGAEEEGSSAAAAAAAAAEVGGGGGDIYTIDAAKRRKYDELFPVEAKKFGYDPKSMVKSVEEALDDRVKKKADRYCK